MPVMTNGNEKPYTGIFGPPRNTLLSKWDLLFEKNPKEWIAFKPALGLHVYPCYACRHMFYSKRSFLYHINRRTVVLTYTCPDCPINQKLTFYNRCAFLVHARKHFSLQRGSINMNNLEVSPLPFGLAGFTKDPDIPFLYDDEEEYNQMDVFVNSQFYAAKYEDRGKETITLLPSNLVINKTTPNGESQALSVLQIAKNIPKCQFILLEHLNRLRRQARISEEINIQVKTEPLDERAEQNLESSINGGQHPEHGDLTLPVITKIESVEETAEETTEDTTKQHGHLKADKQRKHPMYKCPECKRQLEESLIEHFMAENRPADINLKCDECRLICSSKCSYLAHIRIHDARAPYICPDCGQEFHEFIDLNTHMEDICFHSSKSVRYRCPKFKCAKLFASSQTYSTHFALHMDPLYKCMPCDIIFRDLDLADDHISFYRDEPDQHDVIPLYECSVCSQKEPFDEIGCKNHIEWHMNDLSKCLYIYLCKYCKSYFRATASYASHLVKCSVQNKAKKVVTRRKMRDKPFFASKYETGECKKCKNRIIYPKGKLIELCRKCLFAENKLNKLNGTKESLTNGSHNEKIPSEVLNETKHLEQPNGTSSTTEGPSNTTKKSNAEEVKHFDVTETKKGAPRIRIRKRVTKPTVAPNFEKVVCILCKKHMALNERKIHQHECKYARPEVLVERIDIGHLNGNMSMPFAPQSIDMDSSSGSCSWSSSSRHSFDTAAGSPSKPKRRRVLKAKKPFEIEADLTADKPIEFDGIYVCRLCDFKEPERARFHGHVKSHRQLSTAYQCMECGECFVVKRSLIIHIQHFHNIHDYEKYFEENDCFDKAAVDELAKQVQMPHYVRNVDVKENQCKVCLLEFDSKEKVAKHFRVHGMAFLMQKNKQGSV